MTYELIYHHSVEKFVSKLPKHIRQRIKQKLKETKENPFHFFEPLEGRDEYKLRIGKYRVLAYLDSSNKKIGVVKVGLRKNVYA